MKRMQQLLILKPDPLALVLGLLTPALALAEEKANEFAFDVQGYYILNFIVFVAIIVFSARKPLAAFLEKRYADVSKEIAAAHELRDAAQQKYDAYKARMDNLALEMDKILSDARTGTEAEVARILAEAQAQVARVTAEESIRLAQESKRIRDELQKDAAALALKLAEQMVRERLDATAQAKLVERALTEIEQLPSPEKLATTSANA
jgi:F-type H+-transporting ATPase subunit b